MHYSKRAIGAIILASVLGAAGATGFYFAHHLEPGLSPTSGMGLRILASFSCLLIPLFANRERPKLQPLLNATDLWLWGLFGALTFTLYYLSITRIGAGAATILNAGSGVFIAALSNRIAGQKLSRTHFFASLGCLCGLVIFSKTFFSQAVNPWGGLLAVGSGLFGSAAYLMVARAGRRYSTETVALHWSTVNLGTLALFGLAFHGAFPSRLLVWTLLLISALAMSLSQFLTTYAFQNANASLVACLAFTAPLLSLLSDRVLLHQPLTIVSWIGVALVILCGLLIPVAQLTFRRAENLGSRS